MVQKTHGAGEINLELISDVDLYKIKNQMKFTIPAFMV